MPVTRRRLRALLTLLAAALAVAGVVAAPGARIQAGAAPVPLTQVRYAVPDPACGPPHRGAIRCLAVQLKPAARTAKDAQRVVVSATGAGPGGGYTPAQLAHAYGYDRNAAAGATQTVAIVDAFHDPYARAELNAFDAYYGLPAETSTSFRQVNQSGATSPAPAVDAGWSAEIALDIETVRAVCQRCRILLVEASAASSVALAAAENTAARMGATEISNSYGSPETPGTADPYASAYDHPGVVITASTGDSGWYDWDLANQGNNASDNAPQEPASLPTVVAVGGTRLELAADGSRAAESVWNDDGPSDGAGLADSGSWLGSQGAAGGGCSTVYPAPSWQTAVAGWAQTGCGGKRLAADVAADAAPGTGFSVYSHYAGSPWALFGGTSLASPLIAGMWALAGGSGGVRYPAQSLYDHLAWAPAALHDVTTGSNSFCGGADPTTCQNRVLALTGNQTGNPNNLANTNPYYQSSWAGLLDCGFDLTGNTDATVATNGQCTAGAGYDGPSGVGTPNGLAAFTRMGPSTGAVWPALLRVGRGATFAATGFRDAVPGATAASYIWNWGDATRSAGARATHAFRARGVYTVILTVTDSAGRSSAIARRYAVGYAPSVRIAGVSWVRARSVHIWSARTADYNTGGRVIGYQWRIGSRVVGYGAALRAHFARRGRYLMSLTVTDNSGLRAYSRIIVRVG